MEGPWGGSDPLFLNPIFCSNNLGTGVEIPHHILRQKMPFGKERRDTHTATIGWHLPRSEGECARNSRYSDIRGDVRPQMSVLSREVLWGRHEKYPRLVSPFHPSS
jgi:hypothetical protein